MDLNQLAFDLELPDLSGKMHRLSDQRGRIVILNFWSAECPIAERVDSELSALLHTWSGKVVLLTIAANAGETDEVIAAAARERRLPIVLRGSPQIVDAYQAQTTPHLFVIDAEGILRYRGAFDDVTFSQNTPTKFHIREAVNAILEKRLPETAETPAYGCAIIRFMLE